MIVTRKCLPRRTFLRGFGVALGLPLLDAMVPAFASTSEVAAKPVTRLSFVYVPNGIVDYKGEWTPAADGVGFEFTRILQPLAPFRDHLLVLSGLAHNEALDLPGELAGPHPRASASFLTGAHLASSSESTGFHGGVSIDQIAAKELGKNTQLASLELGLDPPGAAGANVAGFSSACENTISWRTPTMPLPVEHQPRVVFEHLFGDSDTTDSKVRLARIQRDDSILRFVAHDVNSLLTGLGSGDRSKLTEYLDAIRDVERRIQLAEEQSSRRLPVVERPTGIPPTFEEHAKLMFDLQVLAYQCDLTRIGTFMMGHEETTRTYSEIGIPDSHHPLSHHGGDAEKIAKLLQINTFHTKIFAHFLDKLRSTADGDGSLLDHTAILYGSGLSDGNAHAHDNLPILLAGGGAGKIKGGRHLRYSADTAMPRLYGTLLDTVGVSVDSLTSALGKLEPLSLT